MNVNFKIEIKPEIIDLLGNKSVCFKNDVFSLGELNYYTIMKILKVVNPEYYKGLLENKDICQVSITNIINENLNNSPEQILDIILKSDIEILQNLGKNMIENFNELFKSDSFYIDKYKAVIYSNEPIDYRYVFSQFDKLKLLFIYNPDTQKLDIVNKKGLYLNKSKKIKSEKELDNIFNNFNENKIKTEVNNSLNELIRKIINNFFNLEIFFEEFIEEIINRLGQLIMIVDLDEETRQILDEKLKELPFNERLGELIANKMKNKTKEITNKYGIVL